ncbi:DUF11 domain-containing protein [Stenotrophobium rhamnosiphilum]|uniref:DUF11 domain-containing protein n=1 Tax=Stenotrophobium rhamnosiphilum TaxID=2029166 RepID=UPI001374AB38|nr:DUF11 domain-containing protein [Stenotrophobium rhamnosiphilum]
MQKRTDTTVIGENTSLKLVKSVDTASAMPGAILTYTVTYTNQSSEPLNSLVINDTTPAFTTFVSASAGAFPNNLTACMKTTPAGGPVPCAAVQPAGGIGALKWIFTGVLQPGASGAVTFQAKIDP